MEVSFIPSVCEPLDGSKVTEFFSRYPAAISVRARDVEDALTSIGNQACEQGSREWRRAQIRNSNPYGNAFAICHCSAYPERLVLLSAIIEVMWIHDDITEELDYSAACKQHEILGEVLRLDVQSLDIELQNTRANTLATMLRKAIDMDPAQAPLMIETLKTYLKTFDSRDDDFSVMEEYMPYRIANCGYWISSYFIRWGMGISLSDEDYESIREYDIAMGNVLGLTNDYFSWNVEKDQQTDRIRNGVRVLMKEHQTTDDIAKTLLLGVIVKEESRAARLKEERLKKPASKEILLYFEAIELYVGGSCYWHATAPRYRVYE